MWRRAAWAVLGSIIAIVGPSEVCCHAYGSGLGVMEKAVTCALLAPKRINVIDCPIDVDCFGPVANSANFVLRKRIWHSNVFTIYAVRWNCRTRNFNILLLRSRERSSKREISHSYASPMSNLKGGSRTRICYGQVSQRAFSGGKNFCSSRIIARQCVDRISNIYDGSIIEIDERSHLLASCSFLLISYPDQQSRKNHQEKSQSSDDNVSDFTFAYKILAPLAWGIWSFACAVISRRIYIRTELPIIEAVSFVIGLSGPLGAFCGFWWWALY